MNHGAALEIFSSLPLELRREIYPYTLVADDESITIEQILKSAPYKREPSGYKERDEFYTALDFHIHKATASDRKDALSFLLGHNAFLMWPETKYEKLLALTQGLSEAGYPTKIQKLQVMIDINLIPQGSVEFDQFGQAPEAYRALTILSQLEQIESFSLVLRRKQFDQFDIRNDKLWDPIKDIKDHVSASSKDPGFQVSLHIELTYGGTVSGDDISWMWGSEVGFGNREDDEESLSSSGDDEDDEEDISSSGDEEDDDDNDEDLSSSGDDEDGEEDLSSSRDGMFAYPWGISLDWIFFWR